MAETPSSPSAAFTPVQLRTLAALRRGEPLEFDEELIAELRDTAERGLGELGERLTTAPPGAPGRIDELFVTKHAVAGVLACEAQHVAPDDFSWTPARARGQVSHKAVQLLLSWRGEPVPADLVDEALARLGDDERSGVGDYVAGLGPGDRAELHGMATERVTKFLECFPPLERRWHPMTESSARFPAIGPIQFSAKVDLVVGRPAGRESRKVIVDLKSGRLMPRHREDLRFYALVETLCRDVPPRKLATFSLDSGTADVEDVSAGLLRSSLRRTLDAVERIVELRVEGRIPTRTPGPTCRWCTVAASCVPGQAYLTGDGEAADEDDPDCT